MSLFDILLLIVAGFAAGGMNALAGGGTFFSFPALLAIGLPPVTANATNAVALWPASLAGAWAARTSLRPLGRYLVPLLLAGLAGGLLGGILLLVSGDDVFSLLIPWLLLLATALFAASPLLSRWLASRRKEASEVPPHGPLSLAAHGVVSIYGGYFGAGMGILQLAAFSIEGHALVRANALKNLISAVIYSVATATFIVAGRVKLVRTGDPAGRHDPGRLCRRRAESETAGQLAAAIRDPGRRKHDPLLLLDDLHAVMQPRRSRCRRALSRVPNRQRKSPAAKWANAPLRLLFPPSSASVATVLSSPNEQVPPWPARKLPSISNNPSPSCNSWSNDWKAASCRWKIR